MGFGAAGAEPQRLRSEWEAKRHTDKTLFYLSPCLLLPVSVSPAPLWLIQRFDTENNGKYIAVSCDNYQGAS
jgi:hypothetical protein